MVKDGWWNGALECGKGVLFIGLGKGTPQLIWESDLFTKSIRKRVSKVIIPEGKGKRNLRQKFKGKGEALQGKERDFLQGLVRLLVAVGLGLLE